MNILFPLLAAMFVLHLPARETGSLWDRARATYDQGDFSRAADIYAQVREEHGTSAALEYNLGNTHMRLGNLPEAVGHYRRAQWLDPGDPDLAANLERALELGGGRVPDLPLPRRLSGFATAAQWQTAFLALCWALALYGAALRFRPAWRGSAAWVLPLLILGLALAGAGVWASRPSPLAHEAVLRGDTITARFEPLDDATAHFTLPGASIIRFTDRTRGWLRITAEGKEGWIPQQEALLLQEL